MNSDQHIFRLGHLLRNQRRCIHLEFIADHTMDLEAQTNLPGVNATQKADYKADDGGKQFAQVNSSCLCLLLIGTARARAWQ